MTTKAETQTISLTFDLPHRPEKVWRALTDPELLARWLMSTDMQARAGNRFTFKSEPTPWWNGIVNCEVLEVELHKRLRYTWQGASLDTVVTWTLTPTASGGTRLALEHSGFRSDNVPAFEGARQGWQRMAGELLGKVLASET